MNFGVSWCILLLASSCWGMWRWPEPGSATKELCCDGAGGGNKDLNPDIRRLQSEEMSFKEPEETEGFYNRPPGKGRYPMRVVGHKRFPYRINSHTIHSNDKYVDRSTTARPTTSTTTHKHLKDCGQHKHVISDGTLDSLQYCKCVSSPDCNPSPESIGACGFGKFLCCYPRPNNMDRVTPHNEFFNEVEDERPMLLPSRENLARPFPPPPMSAINGLFGSFGPGHDHDSSHIGVFDKPLDVLVGPGGPSGVIGPGTKPQESSVLVGPGGPTGIVGPMSNVHRDGTRSETAQSGVFIGPVGPSGIIRSYNRRPVLTGPGGPTGIIGPARGVRGPNVLVGPGGPTGIIGPGFNGQPGLLTGPGGPTGAIGPRRTILVGPGGPTGQIGPQRFYGK